MNDLWVCVLFCLSKRFDSLVMNVLSGFKKVQESLLLGRHKT